MTVVRVWVEDAAEAVEFVDVVYARVRRPIVGNEEQCAFIQQVDGQEHTVQRVEMIEVLVE